MIVVGFAAQDGSSSKRRRNSATNRKKEENDRRQPTMAVAIEVGIGNEIPKLAEIEKRLSLPPSRRADSPPMNFLWYKYLYIEEMVDNMGKGVKGIHINS